MVSEQSHQRSFNPWLTFALCSLAVFLVMLDTILFVAFHGIRMSFAAASTSDDITADWKRLKAAGVDFVEDPKDYGRVWVATFTDPDGNLLQLLQFGRTS